MQRHLVSAFIALFLALHAWPVVMGTENFPLTSALMFSRDIGEERPLYTLHWWVTDDTGARSEVFPIDLHVHQRHFFLHVYLPDHTDSPYHGRARATDSPAAYAERMGTWFGLLAQRWSTKTGATPVRIDLAIEPYGETAGDTVDLGTFDVASARFIASNFDSPGLR